jgi:replicative DNA helicase
MEIKILSKKPGIGIDALIDNPADVLCDYQADNQKISFAGDNFKLLEDKMNGGFLSGRIYLLGGVPGEGVTTMLNNLVDNLCFNGIPVLFFSYGVSRSEIRYRTFARFSKHSISDFNDKKVSTDVISAIMAEPRIKMINTLKYVCDAVFEIESWELMMEQICTMHTQPPVIVIDNIRKIFTPETFDEERFRIEYILQKLSMMARKYHIPVVASSELARMSYKAKFEKINMACLKESGSLEYEAAWVGVLFNCEGQKILICLKASQGTGDIFSLLYAINVKKMIIQEKANGKPFSFNSY